MKKYIILFLLVSTVGFSQNLNDYKYAVVPSKFSFLKDENMYNLNVLTKMFMQKYGFETYLSNETAPDEFVNTNCNKIFVDLVPNNNIFTTKVKVVLKDCKGTILYSSEEGSSRDKEYRIAYNEALRMAFDSFSILKTHKYVALEKKANATVESVKANEQPVENDKITTSKYDSNEWTYVVNKESNGYLITDKSNSKFFLQLLKTNNPLIFIGKSDRGNGVVMIKDDHLIYEYYENNILISMLIMVKI